MAFFNNTTKIIDENGVTPPSLSSDPANPITGQVYYNTSLKRLRQWDGTIWQDVVQGNVGFKYRQIINKGYVLGGYKDSSPWKNVNRMSHATDVCTNLGDQLVYSASYIQGAPSKTTAWVFCAADAHSVATTNMVGFTLATETARAFSSTNSLTQSRQDAGAAFKEHDYVYVLSNGNPDKFDYTTETCTASGLGLIANGTGSGVQAINHETHALTYNDSQGQALYYATATAVASVGTAGAVSQAGATNQQKAINSKNGKGYAGNEGNYNGGYNFRVVDFASNTTTSTVAKPDGNSGEENYDMGQDWQYMMGNYNGLQNNNGHKFFYATNTGSMLGAGSVRTGVPGGSSGATGWA